MEWIEKNQIDSQNAFLDIPQDLATPGKWEADESSNWFVELDQLEKNKSIKNIFKKMYL